MAAIGLAWKGKRKVSDIRRFKIVLLAPSFLGPYPQMASERPNVCRLNHYRVLSDTGIFSS